MEELYRNSLRQIGNRLLAELDSQEFSARRGVINELFPFIFEASKRMSGRAIARWLVSNGVKLSAVTIAKALRNPKPYWEEYFERIEPSALTFEKAHDASMEEFLEKPELFELLAGESPKLEIVSREEGPFAFVEYETAVRLLREEWFGLPVGSRETCLSYVSFSEADDEPAGLAAKP